MKIKISHKIFLALITFQLSCSEVKNDKDPSVLITNNENIMSGSWSLELDSLTSFNIPYMDAVQIDGIEYLAHLNRDAGLLYFVDLADNSLDYLLTIPAVEEQGINRPSAFYFHNRDSIFIVGEHGSGVQLYNLESERIDTYIFKNETEERLFGFARRPMANLNKIGFVYPNLFIAGHPKFELMDQYALFNETPLEIVLNIETEKYEYLPFYFPDNYRDKLYNFNFSSDLNELENKIIFNYSSVPNLILFDLTNFEKSLEKKVQSQFIKEIKPRASPTSDLNEYLIREPFYFWIQFDPYKKLYYRLAYHGQEFKNLNNEINNYYSANYSIIITDENLNILKEFELEKGRYDPNVFFISKNGLHLSTSNPNNPDLQEDIIQFDIFNYEVK